MIDKAELRIPRTVPFTESVERYFRPADYASHSAYLRPTGFYAAVGDLREHLGIPAILHRGYKFGNKHESKIELLDTGEMNAERIREVIRQIVKVNPDELELMRVDLCADIPNVPVLWFQKQMRVKAKQFASEMGIMPISAMGRRETETLYFGKRPNLIRVYNKIREWQKQYRKLSRNRRRDADGPSFRETFGHNESETLTRIERQYGGDRIPPELSTLGALFQYAPDYNPFAAVEFLGLQHSVIPKVEDVGVPAYLKGLGFRSLIETQGLQQARAMIAKHSHGNCSRYMEQLERFIPGLGTESLTPEKLFESYRESIRKQIQTLNGDVLNIAPRGSETSTSTSVAPAVINDSQVCEGEICPCL